MNSTNTPYDDVFRTLLNDCSYLILPVINEIFWEHYTGNEQIIFSQNEHFLNQQDGNEQKRITDTSFRIIGNTEKKLLFLIPFHIFAYENHFEEYNTHSDKLNALKQTYENIVTIHGWFQKIIKLVVLARKRVIIF